MADLSKPDPEPSEEFLSPYMEQARKSLEGAPSRGMIGRIPQDPANDGAKRALLRPSGAPLDRSLIGQSFLEDREVARMLSFWILVTTGGIGLVVARDTGHLSMLHASIGLLALAACILMVGVVAGVVSFHNGTPHTGTTWELPHPRTRRPAVPPRSKGILSGGEEERLARHSAAALWNLHDGKGAKTWGSDGLSEWRARLDLREEAAHTIRSAGALQELREVLGDFPAHQGEQAQARWRDDYAVYSAGLAALRERVQYQLALQLAMEEADHQLDTPHQDRNALTGRIAADLPSHEQAIENLSDLACQSADLVGIFSQQVPAIESPASQIEHTDTTEDQEHSEHDRTDAP